MKNKDFQERLKQFPDDVEVWTTVWNGHVETYGLVDEVYDFRYESISNDFFGTPGRMDKRLFENHRNHNDEERILLVSSDFGSIPNKDVDFGDDDINYPVKTLNGEDGDPDLVWKLNNFEESMTPNRHLKFVRHFATKCGPETGVVAYYPDDDKLYIENPEHYITFEGNLTGIEDIRRAMELCRVPFSLYI